MVAQLNALKVEIVGEVTSFRYPHFTQGYQPTYDMPPPSTIYGHLCSAVGRFLTAEELSGLRFGYIFKHSGKFVDYMEHLHFDDPIQPFPFNRELLFRPRLTLYLTGLDLEAAFRKPNYMVVLGRSQDLMSYESIKPVTLQRVDRGYLEYTLMPMWMAARMPKNVTVATMARYIDPYRHPSWDSYALLQDTVEAWPPYEDENEEEDPFALDDYDGVDDIVWSFEGDEEETELWAEVDGVTQPRNGLPRAIWLHHFKGDVS